MQPARSLSTYDAGPPVPGNSAGSHKWVCCRVPVGQGQTGVALQQVITSPVLLATLAGMLVNALHLPVPPTVRP